MIHEPNQIHQGFVGARVAGDLNNTPAKMAIHLNGRFRAVMADGRELVTCQNSRTTGIVRGRLAGEESRAP